MRISGLVLAAVILLCYSGCTVVEVEPVRYGVVHGVVRLLPPRYDTLHGSKTITIRTRNKPYVTTADDTGYWRMTLPRGVYSLNVSSPAAISDTTEFFEFIGLDTLTARPLAIQQVEYGWVRVDSVLTEQRPIGTDTQLVDWIVLSSTNFSEFFAGEAKLIVFTSEKRSDLESWRSMRDRVSRRMYYEPRFALGVVGRSAPHYYWRALLMNGDYPCFDTTKGSVFDGNATLAATPIMEVDHR